MTKPADTSRSLLDAMTGLLSTMSAAPVGSMLARQALEMQKGIAGEVNQAAHDWLDRRQEAVTSLVATAQKVMDKGLADTTTYGSMQEWYAGMLERTAADFKSPYDLMLACSAHVVPQTAKSLEKPAAPIRRAA
ncbi:hypothetical protein LAZ29_15335 [Cereibacter sphaeroides]|uniref:hypothetical protein n=1 Tax=Cereibacter sphaeroides TaxID=1063 RepID=UPI001F46F2B2|nr:hypothetical protein [Cereibacter sphaeroides]MCE6952305.1 hypothetical protein [Cereibacter sphaeroides]